MIPSGARLSFRLGGATEGLAPLNNILADFTASPAVSFQVMSWPLFSGRSTRGGGTGKAGRMTVTGSKNNLTVACPSWDLALGSSPTGDLTVRVD